MDQTRHEIETRFNISIAKSTVREHLLKESYTVKAVRFEPERANTMENKRKRKMYVER